VNHANASLKKINTYLSSAEKTLRNPNMELVHKALRKPLEDAMHDLTMINTACGRAAHLGRPVCGDVLPTSHELKVKLDKCKKLDICMMMNINAAKKQRLADGA
jgi:hypothetical protein